MRILLIIYTSFVLSGFCFGNDHENEVKIEDLHHLSAKEKVDSLLILCWSNREKDTDAAIFYGNEGVKIALAHNFYKEAGLFYDYIGVAYQHYKKQAEPAIAFYNKALKYSIMVNDSINIGFVYNNLGDAFCNNNNIPLALEYGEKSLNIFKKLKHPSGMAYAYVNLGMVAILEEEYHKAINHFEKAIALRKAFNDKNGIASATLELANIYFKLEKFTKSFNLYKSSFQQHQAIANKNYMAYSLNGMGNVFLWQNQLDSAKQCFDKALLLCSERVNRSGEISSLIGLSKVALKKGNFDDGLEKLNQARMLAYETQSSNFILQVEKAFGDFYDQSNLLRKATNHYQKFIKVYDSLFVVSNRQTVDEMKNRFQITEELYKTKEKLKERKRLFQFVVLVLALLLLFIGMIIWRLFVERKLKKDLQTSNITKDKLFSIISHDLVSPFNILIGYSELLSEDLDNKAYDSANEKSKELLKTAIETNKLIINLLNWSRTQQDKIIFEPEGMDIDRLIREIIEIIDIQASKKKIVIDYKSSGPGKIDADINQMRITISNLIANAIKFTPENGRIQVIYSSLDDKKVKIEIIDSGVGILEEQMPTLFDPNVFMSSKGTNNERGSGLGLILCKEFVDIHNGEIEVKSVLGKGTNFTIILPTQQHS